MNNLGFVRVPLLPHGPVQFVDVSLRKPGEALALVAPVAAEPGSTQHLSRIHRQAAQKRCRDIKIDPESC